MKQIERENVKFTIEMKEPEEKNE
jgi:hypothetical protein